ncbi:MAG: DUF885 domain-containing protein [Sphingomonas bacterium]|nr:DUF885 domain-containing protein [Sphingomonas bacterium]
MFSRREALGSIGAAGAATLLGGCATAQLAAGRPASEAEASALLDSIAENLLAVSPETATSLGIDKGARAGLRSQLSDRSASGQARIAANLRADLARAEAIDTTALTFATRTSVEVVRSAYRTAIEGFALPYGDVAVGGWRNTPYVVVQNVGAYLDVPRFLDSDHVIANAADAEAYLARLDSFARQVDGETGRLKSATARGAIPPAFLLDKAMKQMGQVIDGARKGGGLVESIERRTKNIPGDWASRARAIAAQQVAPALTRQLAELQAQRGQASMAAGIWARPMGDEYYRWALKTSTTTTLSPDEVHQTGLANLKDLHGRMDPILKSLGYTQGTVGARMQALAKDPRYKFAEGDPGRAEIMAFIQERLAIIRKQLPRAFRTLVRGNLEVKRLPPEEEPGAPGAYGGAGSIDGSIPGKFWINLRTTDLHSKYSLPDLAAHEAIPGHVWQGEYSNQLPLIRTMLAFNAYSEGWALYAEQLVDELGIYDDFPVGRLGYLQSVAFRACRLVVDTGLHAKRWTREQGVRFFVEVNGSNPEEVGSEVDRYCSWPGQACGYKVGMNEINHQRDRAKASLGPRYDLRDFNDTVVKGGNVPLDVLAKNVDDYVRTAKA